MFLKIFSQQHKPKIISFRGQGFTENDSLLMAEQRLIAWQKENQLERKFFRIVKKNIKYAQKNSITVNCHILCMYLRTQ